MCLVVRARMSVGCVCVCFHHRVGRQASRQAGRQAGRYIGTGRTGQFNIFDLLLLDTSPVRAACGVAASPVGGCKRRCGRWAVGAVGRAGGGGGGSPTQMRRGRGRGRWQARRPVPSPPAKEKKQEDGRQSYGKIAAGWVEPRRALGGRCGEMVTAPMGRRWASSGPGATPRPFWRREKQGRAGPPRRLAT